MSQFDQELQSWSAFYSVVAAVAATLLGLLFVSLSINRSHIMSASLPALMHLARRSCGDLIFLLMIALISLVPSQMSYGLAIAWFTLGLQRGVELIAHSRKSSTKDGNKSKSALQLTRVYGLPMVSSAGLILVSVFVFLGHNEALYILVPVIAAQLGSAIWNACLLLTLEPSA